MPTPMFCAVLTYQSREICAPTTPHHFARSKVINDGFSIVFFLEMLVRMALERRLHDPMVHVLTLLCCMPTVAVLQFLQVGRDNILLTVMTPA